TCPSASSWVPSARSATWLPGHGPRFRRPGGAEPVGTRSAREAALLEDVTGHVRGVVPPLPRIMWFVRHPARPGFRPAATLSPAVGTARRRGRRKVGGRRRLRW